MITIATDGSCIGNPGPGAFAFVAEIGKEQIYRAIPSPATTVGEMEVRGLLEALLFVSQSVDLNPQPVSIVCDSQYVVNGYNDWMAGWKSKGWTKKGGLAHAALWKQIDQVKGLLKSPLTVSWVRAHQNNGSLNDLVDQIANSAARSQQPLNGPAYQAVSSPPPHTHVKPSYADLLVLLQRSEAAVLDWNDPNSVTLAQDIKNALNLAKQS